MADILPLLDARYGRRRAARVAVFGHSFAARAYLVASNGTMGRAVYKKADGLSAWLEALSGGRLSSPVSLNYGVNGENTTQMLARCDAAVADAVAKGCEAVAFFGIFNDDVSTAAARATTIANITAIAKKWTEAGVIFLISGDFPAGSAANTTFRRTGAALPGTMQVRRWCLDVLPNLMSNIIAYEVWDRLAVSDSLTGDALPLYFQDDVLHPSSAFYADVVAPVLVQILTGLFPSFQLMPEASNSEVYDATNNPRGNILTNGMLSGNNSGLATNWTTNLASGVTVTSSKVVSVPGPWEWQQSVVGGTAAAAGSATDVLRQTLSGAQFAMISPGDTLQAECLTEIDAGFTNVRGLELRLVLFDNIGGGNTYEAKSFNFGATNDKLTNRAYQMFHRTPPLVIPTGALTAGQSGYLALRVIADTAANIAATVRTARMRLHKVLS